MARRRFRKQQKPKQNLERRAYENIVKENEKFVKYYQTQKICTEQEWDSFLNVLKTDLPSTFRITASKDESKRMLEIVEKQFLNDYLNHSVEGQTQSKIFPLPWYPDKLAWQLELSRKDIRRNENYNKLHNYLITETENGTISRQETVSMIPPLLLQVKPHHKVLDMCAAPGSKTAQLIEMLHAGEELIPSGYVVANDIDNKRCYMLVHQAKRLNSPCIAIINHDSAILPNFYLDKEDGCEDMVQFDRILCDVPCSGDGTMRKNPDIWMKWTPANGLNQHGVQWRILKRGAELLAVGGRLVYSTCSLNPLENEAVIHRLLAESDCSLQLVDVSNALPGLKFTQGLENWLVGSRDLEFYENFEEVPRKWVTVIRPQMFPPKPEDREKYNLHRCIRILPHQQNTGAFFVAVLEKVKPLKNNQEKEDDEKDESQSKDDNKRKKQEKLPPRKRAKYSGFKEDPFVFFGDDETVWPDIKSYYDISDKFDPKGLLTRCHTGKKKNIYLTSIPMRELVLKNQKNIKFINTGVRLFVRSDNRNMTCAFRLAQEGLESVFNLIGPKRKIQITKVDLVKLLLNNDPNNPTPTTTLTEPLQEQLKDLAPGSCVLIYTDNENDHLTLHISGWRGVNTFRVYTSIPNTIHLLRLLGEDTSKYEVNKFKKEEREEVSEIATEAVCLDEKTETEVK
ncbi:tRNA (cytosine(34)-C(5))-methyltransferase [Agrilus planipennis]|uniref:tRNA (cytosine(34)-C(5))-methyltransferase n=1 Tax=Agrilus planipennis TaxID=224129 RepID=A0A7F5R6U5_AGRPL|nr:tRNA (cytosine(34)-C(5))-methyltransferase [Agrilus planipennis]